jgi:hypothetical protein
LHAGPLRLVLQLQQPLLLLWPLLLLLLAVVSSILGAGESCSQRALASAWVLPAPEALLLLLPLLLLLQAVQVLHRRSVSSSSSSGQSSVLVVSISSKAAHAFLTPAAPGDTRAAGAVAQALQGTCAALPADCPPHLDTCAVPACCFSGGVD